DRSPHYFLFYYLILGKFRKFLEVPLNFFINKKNNIPILSREDIRFLAEILIEDYCPELLEYPGKLNVDEFMEYYLNLDVEVHELSHNCPITNEKAMTS
ncbi:hypothetical protein, partial [Streptococcus acidominimus]